MPHLEIGDAIELDPKQLAVITGKGPGHLQQDHLFSWGPGRFRVKEINHDRCVIVRLATNEDEQAPRGTEPAMHRPRPFNPREVQQNPNAWPGTSPSILPAPDPTLGPLELKVAEPGTMPAGGTVEKTQIFGPELKEEHPPMFRTIGPIEQIASNKAILMRMVGFKEPKIDPRIVRAAARRLAEPLDRHK